MHKYYVIVGQKVKIVNGERKENNKRKKKGKEKNWQDAKEIIDLKVKRVRSCKGALNT